ncbi:poliovirus receptor-related protein 3 [Platysternon megacephalum]|uniref:Poliovirus receptor-related protein 3 n=1 Tax=Platysternon megacephalum TaxID=55544 RepID=A0A4D9DWA8_9SAUR|nr:poliovirus receptor-related protein 3 [Platysternon megacephalum]
MAGAIIENMSTKKLCIVGGILLIFQVIAFLVGGLIVYSWCKVYTGPPALKCYFNIQAVTVAEWANVPKLTIPRYKLLSFEEQAMYLVLQNAIHNSSFCPKEPDILKLNRALNIAEHNTGQTGWECDLLEHFMGQVLLRRRVQPTGGKDESRDVDWAGLYVALKLTAAPQLAPDSVTPKHKGSKLKSLSVPPSAASRKGHRGHTSAQSPVHLTY